MDRGSPLPGQTQTPPAPGAELRPARPARRLQGQNRPHPDCLEALRPRLDSTAAGGGGGLLFLGQILGQHRAGHYHQLHRHPQVFSRHHRSTIQGRMGLGYPHRKQFSADAPEFPPVTLR